MPRNDTLIDYLKTRRSVAQGFLGEPGPTPAELDEMFRIATRVPDHGKLTPWRLVVFEGKARAQAGEVLRELALRRRPDMDETGQGIERNQLMPAPVVVGVLLSPRNNPKIPLQEQLLSAGNVAFALEHAAFALGYAASWTTRWFAYDEEAAEALGAAPGERFVGFVHIGTPRTRPEDRPRPDLTDIVTRWDAS